MASSLRKRLSQSHLHSIRIAVTSNGFRAADRRVRAYAGTFLGESGGVACGAIAFAGGFVSVLMMIALAGIIGAALRPRDFRDGIAGGVSSSVCGTFLALENELAACRLPSMIVWGREDDVFEQMTFSDRFKRLLPHAEGPHLVTGRHFLQEDSGPEIADLIVDFVARNRAEF
jgi:pimeloyl-ACP methyl ester carboxylesterase